MWFLSGYGHGPWYDTALISKSVPRCSQCTSSGQDAANILHFRYINWKMWIITQFNAKAVRWFRKIIHIILAHCLAHIKPTLNVMILRIPWQWRASNEHPNPVKTDSCSIVWCSAFSLARTGTHSYFLSSSSVSLLYYPSHSLFFKTLKKIFLPPPTY